MNLIIELVIGAVFGYIAAVLMHLRGPWYIYLLLGLVGGLVGNVLFGLIGFASHSLISDAIVSIVGACVIVTLFRALKK